MSSALPDIVLGFGDTAPVTQLTLYQPDQLNGSPGAPMNLLESNGFTPKTVSVKFQKRDTTATPFVRSASVLQTGPTVDVGMILIDWFANGGAVPSDEYNLRIIVTDAAGRQETWPNGPSPWRAYLWLQVQKDFPAP
jgi:hypothetical protein